MRHQVVELYEGATIDIPDDARSVTIHPPRSSGLIKISYLLEEAEK